MTNIGLRLRRHNFETVATGVVSIVIAVVLLLQFTATFDLFPRLVARPSSLFWPFTDYPMYRYARYEGSIIEEFRLFGQRTDGREVEIAPADLGLNFRKWRDLVVNAVRSGDTAQAARFAELYRSRTGTRLVAMRLERSGHALTRNGLQAVEPVQLAFMRVDQP